MLSPFLPAVAAVPQETQDLIFGYMNLSDAEHSAPIRPIVIWLCVNAQLNQYVWTGKKVTFAAKKIVIAIFCDIW